MDMGNSLKILEINEMCTICGKRISQCMSYAHDNMVANSWRICRGCLKDALDRMSVDIDVIVYPI